MSWVGVWVPRAWNGAWFGQGAAAPPAQRPDVEEASVAISAFRALLERPDGLRALVALTQLRATMSTTPIYRGDDVDLTITVLDAVGEPADITGDSLELEIKAAIGGADPALIHKEVGSGITILAQAGETLGMAAVAIPGTETDIEPATYWLDVVHIRAGKRTHVVGPQAFVIRNVVNRR